MTVNHEPNGRNANHDYEDAQFPSLPASGPGLFTIGLGLIGVGGLIYTIWRGFFGG